MNSRIKLILLLSCLGLFGQMVAQIPVPTPTPLPRFPDGDVAYSVKVTAHATPAPASAAGGSRSGETPQGALRTITGARVTCIGQIARYQIAWAGGGGSELWLEPKMGLVFTQQPGSKTVFLSIPNSGPGSLTGVLGPGNSLFGPVGPGNLGGKTTFNGEPCLYYKWTVDVLPEPITYQAWVDEKTGALVALDDSLAVYEFAFDPAPPLGPLVMPPEFKARLDRYLENTRPILHL